MHAGVGSDWDSFASVTVEDQSGCSIVWPIQMCGSEDPHYSRSGDRRYEWLATGLGIG
jgi:hypothetical protein